MTRLLDQQIGTLRPTRASQRATDLRGRRPLGTATQLIQSTQLVRRMALALTFAMIVSVFLLMLLPWQQTSRGAGRVLAFQPMYRPQPITSPVDGVIADVPRHLYEGSYVEQGERLMTIEPTAADMEQQLDLARDDLTARRRFTGLMKQSQEEIVITLRQARDSAERAANEAILSAEARLRAREADLPGIQARVTQAGQDLTRQRRLQQEGIRPAREIEILERELGQAQADLASAEKQVTALEREVDTRKAERDQQIQQAQAAVESAEAAVQRAEAEMAAIQRELRELELRRSAALGRNDITAPRNGVIHRLPVVEGGQAVKAGDYLLTFVPDTDDLAVELNVAGIDLPLVRVGQHVRLQFEGWPALQFSGWPQISVGTFSGEIAVIDPTDDGTGVFRVLVRPDETMDWPDRQWLRQGLRANGWIMMGTVPLGYEVWRQLNGFPPSIDPITDGKDAGSSRTTDKKAKPPLPK